MPTRFSYYEIIRIVIPGIYFIFLLLVFELAFDLHLAPFDYQQIGMYTILVGIIISGLSFYAKETPKKRKAFQTNLPSIYLLERSRKLFSTPLTADESRRLYFYILNQHIPAAMHDKIFFFGMIYQIMINIRRTSFWFGIAGILLLGIKFALHGMLTHISLTTVALVWFIYFLNVRYNKADRKMQENYHDQIFWLEMNRELIDSIIARRISLNTKEQ